MHGSVCPVKKPGQFNNGPPTWNMVRLTDQDRARAVGYVQSDRHVAAIFHVSPTTVGNLIRHYNETNETGSQWTQLVISTLLHKDVRLPHQPEYWWYLRESLLLHILSMQSAPWWGKSISFWAIFHSKYLYHKRIVGCVHIYKVS